MTKSLLVLILLLVSLASEARVEVAFIEAWTRSGKKVELQKGDRFAHVAIHFDGFWLHSSPANGTELIDYSGGEFKVFFKNRIAEVLLNEDEADLTEAQVDALLGRPYDFKFRWSDEYGTYCSKLVGKLLGIDPVAMKFDGSYFQGVKNLPIGELGLSPDGLFTELVKRGYKRHKVFHVDQ